MPVGMPTLEMLSIPKFSEGNEFGYLEATVQAPSADSHAGYLGLLPIKYQGRFICPGGTFTGFFFSEELRFDIDNGYTLLSIDKAYSFDKGGNTFYDLIQELNQMKVEAQLNKQPTIRIISKL